MGPARFLCATLLDAFGQMANTYSESKHFMNSIQVYFTSLLLICDIKLEYLRNAIVLECCQASPSVLRAFVAQWLEHWSCKPGVESSNLSEGFCPNPLQFWITRVILSCTRAFSPSPTFFTTTSILGNFQGQGVFHKSFAQRGARTHDPQIKSLMLYRLS